MAPPTLPGGSGVLGCDPKTTGQFIRWSAARNGSDDRQFDIELFETAGGPVFDPLVAADVATEIALNALLAPTRLQRLEVQHAADPALPGAAELLDAVMARLIDPANDALTRRVAYRAIVSMAQTARRPDTAPDVALLLGDRVHAIATRLARQRGDEATRAWGAQLSRQLLEPEVLERLLKERPRVADIPPGEPIGTETSWMDGL